MATATEAQSRTLTQAYRAQQIQRAALIAALVAAYYRDRVDENDAQSVDDWIELMLPRILNSHDSTARLAASYATQIRRLEVPDLPQLRFGPSVGAVSDQIRKSLLVVGPGDYLNKARIIRTLDVPNTQRTALLRDAHEASATKVAAATVRHVQNGGRQTILDATKTDDVALGYVRVTKAKPCFFCAMLASRGLVFAEDSFDSSDPRFTGTGTAKVHDSCGCSMKPVYTRKDPLLEDTAVYTDLWSRYGAGGGDAINNFRKGYDYWLKTGEYL